MVKSWEVRLQHVSPIHYLLPQIQLNTEGSISDPRQHPRVFPWWCKGKQWGQHYPHPLLQRTQSWEYGVPGGHRTFFYNQSLHGNIWHFKCCLPQISNVFKAVVKPTQTPICKTNSFNLSSRARVTEGVCHLLGTGNQTWVLWKSSRWSSLLSHFSSFIHVHISFS